MNLHGSFQISLAQPPVMLLGLRMGVARQYHSLVQRKRSACCKSMKDETRRSR